MSKVQAVYRTAKHNARYYRFFVNAFFLLSSFHAKMTGNVLPTGARQTGHS
jgi:hypothetical protein